jgi:hypothetical protein
MPADAANPPGSREEPAPSGLDQRLVDLLLRMSAGSEDAWRVVTEASQPD